MGIPLHRPPADRLSTPGHRGARCISGNGHARRCTHLATRLVSGTIVRARHCRIAGRPAGGMSVGLFIQAGFFASTDLPADRSQSVGAQLCSLLRTQCRPQVGRGVMAKEECLPSLSVAVRPDVSASVKPLHHIFAHSVWKNTLSPQCLSFHLLVAWRRRWRGR